MRAKPKQARPKDGDTQQPPDPGIAEKVRFWEEQDRINQVLIPKVLRQHELITNHIKEHDNLPELFRRQLGDALEEQSRRFEEERRENLEQLSEHFRRQLAGSLKEQSRRFDKERRENLEHLKEHSRRELSGALREQSRRSEKERIRLRWLVVGAFAGSLTAIVVSLLA